MRKALAALGVHLLVCAVIGSAFVFAYDVIPAAYRFLFHLSLTAVAITLYVWGGRRLARQANRPCHALAVLAPSLLVLAVWLACWSVSQFDASAAGLEWIGYLMANASFYPLLTLSTVAAPVLVFALGALLPSALLWFGWKSVRLRAAS